MTGSGDDGNFILSPLLGAKFVMFLSQERDIDFKTELWL